MLMGRDTLLKGTESKKEKTKQKPKAVTSKEEKNATSPKKGTTARTKTKKSKAEKTPRKTVREIEKPKAISTLQDIPGTTSEIAKEETIEPHTQVTNKVADEITRQPTKEPEPEKESPKEPESSQESVVVKTEVTMPREPEKNSIWIYGASAALLLLLVLFTASLTNSNTFSFKKKGDTVELWKGSFAPMGMERISTFSDLQLPTDEAGKTIVQETYTKEEAYRILFQYFLSKADDTLTRQEFPDLKEVNALLEEAKEYAFTDDAKETLRLRKNGLRFLLLMEKINLALARNTENDLLAAKEYLAEIEQIDTTLIQRQMIKEKNAAVELALKKISSEKGKEP
jgi:hypothetical protein